jgi:hypothetical protein
MSQAAMHDQDHRRAVAGSVDLVPGRDGLVVARGALADTLGINSPDAACQPEPRPVRRSAEELVGRG